MIVKFEVEYKCGDILYLKTDNEDNKYLLVGYVFYLDGSIKYVLKNGLIESEHFADELSEHSSMVLGN